jgi:hypothetical protein
MGWHTKAVATAKPASDPFAGLCAFISDVGNSAGDWRALVEIAGSANPVITIRHNERKSACNVAANEQNGRERLALKNSLQILVHVRLVTREKREMRGAQQVLRGMLDELSAAKTLNERLGFRIRTQKRKEFLCGVEILSFPFSAHSSFGLLIVGFPSSRISSRMRLSFFADRVSRWHPPTGSPEFASIVDVSASSN